MNDISLLFLSFVRQFLPPTVTAPSLAFCLSISTVFLLFCLLYTLFLIRHKSKLLSQKTRELDETLKSSADITESLRQAELEKTRLETLLSSEREFSSEKIHLLEHAREEMRLQFGTLAQQIFDEKSTRFSELNHEKLQSILIPFKEQLGDLRQEINNIYRTDSRERISLKTEISHLKQLNQQINQEAANLTNALKGSTRIQGNWGELVLERVLEKSGLRKGMEYDSQSSYRDSQNRLFKPDIIVHLPAGKDIIIDSKVSLISWERYINSDEDHERQLHLQHLTRAIRDHIQKLSAKDYQHLNGLESLNFVLMFMPIEAAFSTVCSQDDRLVDEALSQNIIVVTPTTLLATLRTVENIWHNEHQSNNSLEIARRAGLMYDKFRGFVEDVEKIGKQLSVCQGSCEAALNKLCRGKGNLIGQAEQLRGLGVQVKKEIPEALKKQTDYAAEELPH